MNNPNDTGNAPDSIEKTDDELVAETNSLPELYELIRSIGPIQGTEQTYTPDEIIADIEAEFEKAKEGKEMDGIGFITRTYGIRQKARQLIDEASLKKS